MKFADARQEAAWYGLRDALDGISPVYTEVILLAGGSGGDGKEYKILRRCYDEGYQQGVKERGEGRKPEPEIRAANVQRVITTQMQA